MNRVWRFFGGLGCDQRNNPLDFGGDPDNIPDKGIFKSFFIYYRQPTLKHQNLQQWFELFDYFRVIIIIIIIIITTTITTTT